MGGGISRSSSNTEIGEKVTPRSEEVESSSHTCCSSDDIQVQDSRMKDFMNDPSVQKDFRVFLNQRGKDAQLKLFKNIEIFGDHVAEKYSGYPQTHLIPVEELSIPDCDVTYIDNSDVQFTILQSLAPLDKIRTRKFVTLSLLNCQIASAEEVLLSHFLNEFDEYSTNFRQEKVQQNAKAILLADDEELESEVDQATFVVASDSVKVSHRTIVA